MDETANRECALLDVRVVARMLGCSARHIRRLADAQRMPSPVRLGRVLRWSRATVEQWIKEGCPACDPRRGRS